MIYENDNIDLSQLLYEHRGSVDDLKSHLNNNHNDILIKFDSMIREHRIVLNKMTEFTIGLNDVIKDIKLINKQLNNTDDLIKEIKDKNVDIQISMNLYGNDIRILKENLSRITSEINSIEEHETRIEQIEIKSKEFECVLKEADKSVQYFEKIAFTGKSFRILLVSVASITSAAVVAWNFVLKSFFNIQ